MKAMLKTSQRIPQNSPRKSPKKSCTKRLNIKNTSEVCRCLHSLGAQWRALGTYLDIDPNILDKIKVDHPDCNHRLIALVTLWLKQTSPHPTWLALAEVVEFVDPTKAKEIRTIYHIPVPSKK